MATNPNKVIFTGENSGITLSTNQGDDPTTRSSHWRVLWSPAGMGHVLYIQSELTNNERRIYSDNIALTRWLQEGIYGSLHSRDSGRKSTVINKRSSSSWQSIHKRPRRST